MRRILRFNEALRQSITEEDFNDIKEIFSEINDGPFYTFMNDSGKGRNRAYNNENNYEIDWYDKETHKHLFFGHDKAINIILNSGYGKKRPLIAVRLNIQDFSNLNYNENAQDFITNFLENFDKRVLSMGHKILSYSNKEFRSILHYRALIY
jgi:hypothetical protein